MKINESLFRARFLYLLILDKHYNVYYIIHILLHRFQLIA